METTEATAAERPRMRRDLEFRRREGGDGPERVVCDPRTEQ
jgi:hypothetical protein